jgi:predicted enzyme related to lactoylglutathione lyase
LDVLVNIDVDDLDKAVRFYSAAFGLRRGRSFGPSGMEMLGAAAAIYLLVKAADDLRTYKRHWTPVHLDFVVEDINRAVEKALAAGAQLQKPVSTNAWGKLALMADPFGHGFCFVQFVGRGYDEIAS